MTLGNTLQGELRLRNRSESRRLDKSRARSSSALMMNRSFLALTALMFLAFGLWSLVDPIGMTSRLGVEAGGISGVFEMRGVFGGVSLGAAALCALGAFQQRFEFPALCFVAAYMGGYVIGRGASFIAGDTALASNWYFSGFEAVMCLIAITLITRTK